MSHTKIHIVKFLFLLPVFIFILFGIALISQSPESESFRYSIGPPDLSWVDKTLQSLTLREKIGQLIQVRIRGEFLNQESRDFQNLIRDVVDYKVGGLVLYAGNIYESVHLINELQQRSELPLLVAADFERGAAFRIEDTTSFPWAMAVGATGSEEYAYIQGKITAQESRALGVHWIFAPVLDVNNNPQNPVINIRAFGEDPELVARLGTAFIQGARSGGALTTGKHFPGHGDTSVDTHIGLAVVPSDIERLQSIELVPFKSAIEAGVDSIMTVHVAMPEVTKDPEIPATLSPEILTQLLRNTLEYEGIIITDAMEMGGITNRYWCGLAASRAIEAGADVVMLPTDVGVAINEIERAVERGDISVSRIDASLRRILEAKSSVGLVDNRMVPIDNLAKSIAAPENKHWAQEIADHSITVINDEANLLPLDPSRNPKIYSLVLDSGLDTFPGSILRNELRTLYPDMRSDWANARVSDDQIKSIKRQASNAEIIICSMIARLSTGRDISAIPRDHLTIMKNLIETGKPLIWIAFGNPYVLEHFPKIGTRLCTFSDSDVSQIAAARALSGAIPITGRMPVSIPGHAEAGKGLQVPKLEMSLKPLSKSTELPSSNSLTNLSETIDSYIKSRGYTYAHIISGHKSTIIVDADVYRDTDPELRRITPPIREIAHSNGGVRTILLSMLAVESGRLLLDVPIEDYLPEFRDTDLGIARIYELFEDKFKDIRTENGETSNSELIEEIVLRASGSIDVLLQDLPEEALPLQEIFPTDPNRKSGQVSPDSFGLSIPNLPAFLQTLLNRGIYDHRRIFNPSTVARFTNPGRRGKALGWEKPDDAGWTAKIFSTDSFGFMDSDGLFLWADPKLELFILIDADASEDSGSFHEFYEEVCRSIVDGIKP